MGIWEFGQYCDEALDKIVEHCEALEEFDICQNEEMMVELRTEQSKRLGDD